MIEMSEPQQGNQNFTEAENKAFAAKRASMFKGSIAVCVVYGVVALALVLVATLSNSGKAMLTTQFNVFVITLVIGILIVIAIMGFMVAGAKPTKINTSVYDRDMCPDYWKLQKTEPNVLSEMDVNSRFVAGNVCVRDTSVLPGGNASLAYSNTADSTLAGHVNTYAQNFKAKSSGVLDCTRLYPTALSLADEKNYPDQQNKMRCEIAQKCGFAWTSVCP